MGTYLGQNFLIDAKVRSYIADKISSLYREWGCTSLIEIGPGKGSLTKLIHCVSDHFFVIEKDPNMFENLTFKIQNLKLIEGDVLEVDVEKMLSENNLDAEYSLIVGNLPYYITSPILRKFFSVGQNYAGGVFMVQDEVGQKVKYDASKKSYLWRILNYAYEVTYLKGVPAKCFSPAPKVKSCLIQLTKKPVPLTLPWERVCLFLDLFAPYSRKTLGSILKILDKHHDNLQGDRLLFSIPESLHKKRLEELTRSDLQQIL